MKVGRQLVKEKKKVYKKERSKCSNWEYPVCCKLEKLLKANNIDRAAHHGGDLNGGNVAQMLANSNKIFAIDFKRILLKLDVVDIQCPDNEIELIVG